MERQMRGPLRINPLNPRVLTDDTGRGILLTGFHTWNNLVELSPAGQENVFDYGRYLDVLTELGHNCIRLWAWDSLTTWNPKDRSHTHPWARTGPGVAVDGKPKFDLARLDDSYFVRLKDRVRRAGERGIYVSVMLFESWCTNGGNTSPLDWHIFAGANNINGIDVSARLREKWMVDWMALGDPRVTRLQEAYVARVVDELNGLDNVLYEISNEAGKLSYAWQEHMIRYIHERERAMPKRHLVTLSGGMDTRTDDFFNTSAELVAPEGWAPEGQASPYRDGLSTWGDPPEQKRHAVILDTDHIWGIGGNVLWAWQMFCRGYHLFYMDRIDDLPGRIFEHPWWPEPTNLSLRRELGAIRRVADSIDMNTTIPTSGAASSDYCLTSPDGTRIAVAPAGGSIEVGVQAGRFLVDWREIAGGTAAAQVRRDLSAGQTKFASPFGDGACVLLVRATA
jgi:hypothetical protein